MPGGIEVMQITFSFLSNNLLSESKSNSINTIYYTKRNYGTIRRRMIVSTIIYMKPGTLIMISQGIMVIN